MYPEEPVGNPLYLERKGHNQWKNVAKSDTQSTLWKEGIGQDLKKIDFWHESAGLERTLIQGLTKEEYHKYMTEGTEFMNKDEIDKVSNLFRKHGEKLDYTKESLQMKSWNQLFVMLIVMDGIEQVC